jgi:para-nitrobenzyl esterase
MESAACDAQDGLRDGELADPRRCHWSAKAAICGRASLIAVLQKTYGTNAPAAVHEYGLDSDTPPAADPVLGSVGTIWLTDSRFRCGAVMAVAWHAATGAPVYEYQFEQSLPGHEASGAAHGYEIPYVWGNLLPGGRMGGPFTPADHALSDTMMLYWTNFAKNGDPNGAGAPLWPRFNAENRAFVRFSTNLHGNVKADEGLRKSACELYEKSLTIR